MQNLNISFYPKVYNDFVSQLVSLVSGWTNEQDKCLLSFCFENQINIHKIYHDFI